MVQNSKQKAHRGCSCDSCKRGAGTAFGQLIHNANERKLRRIGKEALRKVTQEPITNSERDFSVLDDTDVLSKLNSPYTD